MDANRKSYIQTSAIHGFKIVTDRTFPIIKCPILEDLQEDLFIYLLYVNDFLEKFEDYEDDIYQYIISSDTSINDFAILLRFFVVCEKISFVNNSFIFDDVTFIDSENIKLFLEIIKVLHCRDKKDDDYKPANETASKMMKEFRRRKRETERKIAQSQNSNGSGFLEIVSTISARHPSINLLNIGKLNYFQIIDQYKRLFKIDAYTPCLYGNATEEYIKKNRVEHYSAKLVNE